MPGSCWWEWEAVVEVELGRDIGSRVGGGGRPPCPSSILTLGEKVKGGSPIWHRWSWSGGGVRQGCGIGRGRSNGERVEASLATGREVGGRDRFARRVRGVGAGAGAGALLSCDLRVIWQTVKLSYSWASCGRVVSQVPGASGRYSMLAWETGSVQTHSRRWVGGWWRRRRNGRLQDGGATK